MLFPLTLAAILLSQPQPTLRELAMKNRVNIGTCARAEYLRNNVDGGRYAEVLATEFNLLEPENDLKPPALWKGVGDYDFTNPDFLLGAPGQSGWAAQHSIKVRGHVLVYARDQGYTIPGWLLKMESQITPEQAKSMLHNYINAVVGRYKGKVAMWDVVNEAIDETPNNRPFNLRDSFWFRKLGPDFLVLAFQFAHEADPKAELYYNEYDVEHGGKKGDYLLALADFLKSKHAPITGLGLQYHIGLWDHVNPGDGHYQLLDQIRKRKMAFMITELDIALDVQPFPPADPRHGQLVKNPGDLEAQAKLYGDVFKMALSYPNCHGVQMWGFTDAHSWIPDYQRDHGAALIFDAQYQPKPALSAIARVLESK